MASTIEDGKYYYIFNVQSMTALNVLNPGPGGVDVVGATTVWWDAPKNSVWQAKAGPNSTWRFVNLQTASYMWFATDPALSPLQVARDDPTLKQQWVLKPNNRTSTPTFFSIQNVGTSLFIDLVNGNPSNGAPVVSQTGIGRDNPTQCWVFVPSNGF